jgi:hypothetical protein
MPRRTSKRNADAAGLTVDGLEEGSDRVSKTSRNNSPSKPSDSSTDQKVDPPADYIDLTADYIPLTQVTGADEEDAAAEEIVQDSQDDTATSNFEIYGMSGSNYPLLFCIGITGTELKYPDRYLSHFNCGCALLPRTCY